MKIRVIISLLALLLVGSACEKELDFKGTSEEMDMPPLVINAVAIEGMPFVAYLTKSERINEVVQNYKDASVLRTASDEDYQDRTYLVRVAQMNAQVQVEVNGQQSYQMSPNLQQFYYECDYVPKEGDHIVLTAQQQGSTDGLRAEAVVPQKPKIEVLEHEVLDGNPYRYQNELTFEGDTIMRLTCRISGAQAGQYYRLRVRNERESLTIIGANGTWDLFRRNYGGQDVFFSSDALFADSRLTSNFGGWPSFFSNVFDSRLLENGAYTFTVDSPKMVYTTWNPPQIPGMTVSPDATYSDNMPLPPQVVVELQAISEDYYHYLKAMELYRIMTADANSEPFRIHSNAENGWGILGAMSYDRHIVEYDD